MIELKPELNLPVNAVQAWKHELLVKVQHAILDASDSKAIFSPNDVPEDIIPKDHKKGVASNAWNALRCAEVIERLPMGFTDPALGIYGGRVEKDKAHAMGKGNWVAAYRLKSDALKRTWRERNPRPRDTSPSFGRPDDHARMKQASLL